MLSAEQSFFLSVLADHLNGRQTAFVGGLDWKILYDMAERHQLTALFYTQAVPGSSRCELDCSFHFLFLLMHLKKHIINSGAGFRQFMDLAVAAQKWQLDWKQIESWLSENGMCSFLRITLSLCQKWFQLPLPFAGKALPAEMEQEIAQQIFRNGIFGFDDKSNTDNSIIAELNGKNSESLRSRLQICRETLAVTSPKLKELSIVHFGQILFPDYDYMRNLKICRFLDGHPWLLPAGWIRRLLCGGKNKIQRITSVIRCSRKKFQERRKKLKKPGL